MTTTTFQPSILLSPPSLAHFLSGDEEVDAILRSPPSPAVTARGSTCEVVYYYAVSFFQGLVSYVVYVICMTDLSKKLWVASWHTMHHATAIKAQKMFQNSLLVGSINTHRKDTADYFLQRPLQTSLETQPTAGVLKFFHQNGVCRGMSHWFVYLYFKTHGQFPDSDQHLRAIGRQFEQGAPRQAAFLQSLGFLAPYNLLHLNVTTDVSKISTAGKREDQIIGELQLCPPGVYGIYTSKHQMVYVKIDESRQYLFDPNRGVIKISSATLFKNAMQRYFETHDHTKEIYIDLYTSH